MTSGLWDRPDETIQFLGSTRGDECKRASEPAAHLPANLYAREGSPGVVFSRRPPQQQFSKPVTVTQ